MKRNVAGQGVGAQMNSRVDGSPITSGVSVYVTLDNGMQTSGSGTLTHKGNGAWHYAPTQAETDADHILFTFVHSSGVNQTVNVYTTFPQSGDAYARIGPSGASLTAIPWNAAWDVEVESEVIDGLTVFGVSTHTPADVRIEMDANSADFNSLISSMSTVLSNQTSIIGFVDELETRLTAARAGYLDNLNGHVPQSGDAYAELTAARAEPGQGTPPSTASILMKIDYLFKGWRNRRTSTATTISVYNAAGTVVDHKATHSDDGTIYDRSTFTSGP